MAFPEDPLPVKQELLIDNEWVDITADNTPRYADGVTITRGFAGEQQSNLSAGSCSLALNNRNYALSNRNPLSPYFGKIGRNVQFRDSITESEKFVRLADYSDADGDYDGARVWTADKASLDITGDIDIRIDVQLDDWLGGYQIILASKYNQTGDQRSWVMWIDEQGYLKFRWTTLGTGGSAVTATSTARVTTHGRQALRVVLDVNGTSGDMIVLFYTSDTLSGSWTQLGAQLGAAGSTSIFSSTAPLEIGTSNNGGGRSGLIIGRPLNPLVGRIYGFELRTGINGTIVAQMDPDSQAVGTTSWSDGLAAPNTWTLDASADLTAQDYRFWGEFPDIPSSADSTGTDVFVKATAYDLLSRLMNGSKALNSTIYSLISEFAPGSSANTNHTLDGWWPCEQGANSEVVAAAVGKNGPLIDVLFSSDAEIPGTAGVMTFTSDSGTASAVGVPTFTTANTGTVVLFCYFRAPSAVSGGTRRDWMTYFLTGGNVYRVDFGINDATYQFNIVDATGTSLLTTTIGYGSGAEPTQPMSMQLRLVQNGANIDYQACWYPVGGTVLYLGTGSFAGTLGRPKAWQSTPFTGKSGWWLSHIGFTREDVDFDSQRWTRATDAYTGDRPDERFQRLMEQAGHSYWIIGRRYDSTYNPDSPRMGPQVVQPLVTHLQEIADVDGGYIYGPRDKFGITLHLRSAIVNRDAVELSYSGKELSGELKPRDDLFFARNDVTVTRPGGAFARAVKTDGPNNVNEPSTDPQGIGTYDPGPITRNVYTDDQLQAYAEEVVLFGTWDELRHTAVSVELARPQFISDTALTRNVRALDIADVIRLTGMPGWLPPDDADLLAVGYREVHTNRGQALTFNTAPYGPWRLNDLTESPLSRYRAGATNSSLAEDITGSATSVGVTTPTGKLWGTTAGKPGNFPMDVKFGGEVATVSGIATPWLADDFNRSGSNGWGTTSTGSKTWTIISGTAANFSQNGTVGVINLATTAAEHMIELGLDADVSELLIGRIQMPAAITGVGGNANVSIRIGSSTDYIGFNIQYEQAGTASHWMSQVVGGVETAFDSSFPTTGSSSTTIMSARIKITPTNAYGKIWAQSLTFEPANFTTSITLTQPNTDTCDVRTRAIRNASSTNGNPFYMEFDNFSTPRIQVFTFSARNANAMTSQKAHDLGTAIDVVDGFYVAR